jgi:hypothetical protein
MQSRSKTDGFGAPVSHLDQVRIDRLHKAAVLSLRYAPSPMPILNDLLDEAPDFLMARLLRAGITLVASDKRRQAQLPNDYAVLQTRLPQANAREAAHIHAIGLWLSGDLYAASQAYADILADFPRDLIALQIGHQMDFLLGQVQSTRDRPACALPHWSRADAEYSYLLGMQAFGLEEAGHYAQAEAMALESVTLNPADAWGVHALAHCYEMQGKTEAGIAYMTGHEDDWARDSFLAIHNRWHLCLYFLEGCRFDEALAAWDKHMAPGPEAELMDLHDAAALLWRLRLDGVEAGSRWEAVADGYEAVAEQAWMPFNDMHAMFAFVATGRQAAQTRLIAALERAATGDSTSASVIRTAGLPIARALAAYGAGDWSRAAQGLSAVRHLSHLIGGSLAQRDVLNLTLIDSASRAKEAGLVAGLLAERRLMKPESPLSAFLRSRAPKSALNS